MNVRKFDIVAINAKTVYNKYGDHDPNGKMYVLKQYERKVKEAIKENPYKPINLVQPLVIRANVGDLVEIKFKNKTKEPASIHIQGDGYNVNTSDGANVGFNENTIAKKGRAKVYKWYAKREGTFLFHDMADTSSSNNSTNLHGLFGAIIIEPAESEYFCNSCGERTEKGEEEIIISNPEETFREIVLFMQNGLALYNKDGELIDLMKEGHEEHEEEAEKFDTEDQGQKGFNYRSERYENRLKKNQDLTKVMDSCIHGDPATPLFEAYTGDNMKVRLIMPADKPRNIGFVIHGHSWRQQDKDPLSPIVSTAGAISVGNVFNYTLKNGVNCLPGDYCYRSGSFRWDVEQGMWGILRVYDEEVCDLYPIKDVCKM